MLTEFSCRKLLENIQLEDREGDWRITLRLILERGGGVELAQDFSSGGMWY